MPRPALRRRHLNRYAPSPRAGKKIPDSSPAKLELEKKLAHKSIGQRPNDSDDSDRLVVKGNGRRARPRQEIFASGAVGSGDKPGAYPSRTQRRKNMLRDTKEILANAQQLAEKDAGMATSSPNLPEKNAPLANGKVRKATGAKQEKVANAAPTTATLSSAVKAPGTVQRTTQPTPTRDMSILGGLKPRRRQPSILQDIGHDSSTFDLEDEEQFLPDDESTPFNISKSQQVPATPVTNSSHPSSSSRKRKFGSTDPLQPSTNGALTKSTSSPLTTMSPKIATPQPALPPMPVSTLRESGRKYQEHVRDKDDILAPPESSSSPSSSPAKVRTPESTRRPKKKAAKPGTTMTTEALRALMMPVKRRKTTRERSHTPGQFDIPADSDSPNSDRGVVSDQDDESSFLPTRKSRNTRRKEPLPKSGRRQTKAVVGTDKPGRTRKPGTAAVAKAKSKSSTEHLTHTAPILTPSASASPRRNRKTKSPLQLSTTEISNPTEIKGIENRQKSYGGSRRRRQNGEERPDKENQNPEDGLSNESGGEISSVEEIHKGASDRPRTTGLRDKTVVKASQGKWADIDAWDMDFEEVEVLTGSGGSSPMRR
ncbi:hypothetical protein LTR99_008792 [Exophiala xenobiotica]|uniref:Uncharacterized protein n=1 Tax=Vermiconidia calcicola TaxID=1690605 RepID=A0AAV9Q557_9PEZI|nr:hypothetical protein LTR96_009062 [Exophiala xenobiotica]KAK5533436.1 hypothetical protein LTR25_007302 [Vermiconidia calcicola]KAK5542898.1 hypothetical protein LTR23_005223 [Chaetothyriales sp. CCFEE 6169]KAK5296425.1 hypothetical protein LTR99_008792 [Exophiala xenobiotica]KAK5334478.1 hypothetical protein LTR98_009432 [Exophiala xenobiotica]